MNRGRRIGEASNPGPKTSFDDVELDPFEELKYEQDCQENELDCVDEEGPPSEDAMHHLTLEKQAVSDQNKGSAAKGTPQGNLMETIGQRKKQVICLDKCIPHALTEDTETGGPEQQEQRRKKGKSWTSG